LTQSWVKTTQHFLECRYQFARTNNFYTEKISCEFSFPTGEFKRFEHFSDFDQLQTEVS